MWKWDYLFEILPQIASCLGVTISAALGGFVLALLLGLLFAVLLKVKYWFVKKPIEWFIEIVRSTPLLVQLYILYYVLPEYGILLSSFVTGVIGLGIHYSTYLSEVYRSGIEAVPKGQWEAADAIGFSKVQTWIKIVIPQAVPPIIPIIGNYLVTMFKETPILSAIALVEIMQKAKLLGAVSFRYIEGFTVVGVMFIIISYVATLLVQWVSRKASRRYTI